MKKGTKKKVSLEDKVELIGENYKVTLKCVGRVYKSEGETLEEALRKIKISGGARALSILKVEKDGVEKERILNGRHTNGIFGQGSPTMKAIHLKQILAMFDI